MRKQNLNQMFRKDQPYVTYVLLAIQIVLYLLMEFSGGSTNVETLVRFGAKFTPLIVLEGEVWRLITPMFLHIGFTHLLMNSITLYYLGSQMEQLYGSGRFLVLYLLAGFMGNVFSFAFSHAISAGASTSLFGLFAIAVVLGRLHPYNFAIRQLAQGFLVLIIINFVSGFMSSSIDNWGHLGGVVGGALSACFISLPRLRSLSKATQLKFLFSYLLIAGTLIFYGFYNFEMVYYW